MLEPALLAAGVSHWELERYELYRVNPPLVRMVAALPVLAVGCQTDWKGFQESSKARPEFIIGANFVALNGRRSLWLLTLARWACIPFSLIGGIFAFHYSQELWRSNLAGLVTLAVWCFEPNILGHAELITNDVACTALGLGATWLFWRWLKNPEWLRAIAAGIVLGLALLTKSSWLILLILWPLLTMLWHFSEPRLIRNHTKKNPRPEAALPSSHESRSSPESGQSGMTTGDLAISFRPRRGVQLSIILSTALYLLNMGYRFDETFTPLKEFEFVSRSLKGVDESNALGNRFRHSWIGRLPLPFPKQYILGLDIQKSDFENWSRPSYLRGEWKQGGWWYYYLYGLLVKLPHGFQLLILMTAAVLVGRSLHRRSRCSNFCASTTAESMTQARCENSRPDCSARDLLVLISPGLLLFLIVSAQTRMNEHFRYVLPFIGMLTVLVGCTATLARPNYDATR